MDDARPQPLDGLDLELVRVLGHTDGRRDSEHAGGVRHPEAVVAGGSRDHAHRSLLGVHRDQLVERPPDLEGPDRLGAFDLQVDVAADLVREGRRVLQRGRLEVLSEGGGGLRDRRRGQALDPGSGIHGFSSW